MKNLPQKPFGLVFGANPTFGVCIVGLILILGKSLAAPPAGGLKIDPTTGLPIAGGLAINPSTGLPVGLTDNSTTPVKTTLKPFPKPPVPKRTTTGHYNLKNGQVISGTIIAITTRGVLINVAGGKGKTRLPLYYMYPHELTRDSGSLNKFLMKANEQSSTFYQAFCFFHGYGKQPNIKLALKYFENSAIKDGYLPAAHYLQWIYQSGDAGVQLNVLTAAKWQQTAQDIANKKVAQIAASEMSRAESATMLVYQYNETVKRINEDTQGILVLESKLPNMRKLLARSPKVLADYNNSIREYKIDLQGLYDDCLKYEKAITPQKYRIPRQPSGGTWSYIVAREPVTTQIDAGILTKARPPKSFIMPQSASPPTPFGENVRLEDLIKQIGPPDLIVQPKRGGFIKSTKAFWTRHTFKFESTGKVYSRLGMVTPLGTPRISE